MNPRDRRPETGRPDREPVLGAGEVALVCARYDIGVVESVRPLLRGSERAPKALLKTSRGRYLLKRRAGAAGDPARVALGHEVMLHLASKRFPVPEIVGTRVDNNSILQINSDVYEMFRFVDGVRYSGRPGQARAAGAALRAFHDLTGAFSTAWPPSGGWFHHGPGLPPPIASLLRAAGSTPAGQSWRKLRTIYEHAATQAEQCGVSALPARLVHGDWHPGNLLFRGAKIAAVLDFDSLSTAPRVCDIANGALQFSLRRRGEGGYAWPEQIDEERFRSFCDGYHAGGTDGLEARESAAVPWLMIESLIVEAGIVAAVRRRSADPRAVLAMVSANAGWLERNAPRLVEVASEGGRR